MDKKASPYYYKINDNFHLTFLGLRNLMTESNFKIVKNELNEEKWIIDDVEKTAVKIDIEKEVIRNQTASGKSLFMNKYGDLIFYNRAVMSAVRKFPRFKEILEKLSFN